MKHAIFIALLVAAGGAAAADSIDLKSEKALIHPGRTAWAEQRYPNLTTGLAMDAQRACPAGFEKVREYAAPEGPDGIWYLHFVVRCITPPATPVASVTPAPR